MKKQTKAIHTAYVHPDAYNALNFPVYQSVSYEFADAQAMSDAFSGISHEPNYSRTTNPTVTHFEHKVRELANAPHTTAFNSGMAAISNTLFALSAKGKTIVTTRHLFGNTFSLIVQTLGRFGVKVRLCDLTNKEAVEKAMDETVCCIFFEILTNPQLEVANIADLAAIAHSNNVPLVADSTMIPFTEINLGEQGVDIEVVSSTKYISGGATSLGGLVIDYGTTKGFHERMTRELLYNLGGPLCRTPAERAATGTATPETGGHRAGELRGTGRQPLPRTGKATVRPHGRCHAHLRPERPRRLLQFHQPPETHQAFHQPLRQPHAGHPSREHHLRQFP